MKRFTSQTYLATYSGVLTLLVTVALLSGFTAGTTNTSFDTITVQRINVVEPDGTLRMVISNNKRVPAIIIHGHEYSDFTGRRTDTTAGMLFYDAHGTESGGLTFGGRKTADGVITRFGHLSFDRYNQDQMFAIDASDDGTNHVSRLRMLDQPNWSIEEYLQLLERIKNLTPEQQAAEQATFFQTHPLSVGIRTYLANENYPGNEATRSILQLKDPAGKERTRLGVSGLAGTPSLEFLDENGTITDRYPPN